MDLRGHGDSDWSATGDYRLDAFRDDVRAVMGGFDRPVILVGASLGGFSRKVRHAAEWRPTQHRCDLTGKVGSKAFIRWRPAENAVPIEGFDGPKTRPVDHLIQGIVTLSVPKSVPKTGP